MATFHEAYPESLRAELLAVIQGEALSVAVSSELETRLSHHYAAQVQQLLQQQQVHAREVVAIGLHGQTVDHQPTPPLASTTQWGNPAVVAAITGIDTINQFRQLDVAMGGQGAPLAPVLHHRLMQHNKRPSAVINLGGIANLTTLKAGQLVGFDTGPANCLMDDWCQQHTGQAHDTEGQWAASGRIIPELLDRLLQDGYFQHEFPKSTGRELFNLRWLNSHLGDHNHKPEDVQRTLLALTVCSIKAGLLQAHSNPEVVYLCGGGVHNTLLVSELSQALSVEVLTTAALGVDPDFVEAVLMAWLAHHRSQQRVLDLSSVTGATSPLLYGTITSTK